MGSIIDEDSDISDSEMDEYKEITYKLFKFRTYKIRAPDGKFRCPFCADKEEVYQHSLLLLLQHAVQAAESSKNSVKRSASHSAMANYLVINSVELPTQECYQRLIEKLKEKEDELQKVCKALVEGWIHEPDNLPVTIGIKTMGKLDLSEIFPQPPGGICFKSVLPKFRWRCLLMDNPKWYPFHVENHQGITQKVVNEDDELLKDFKDWCGLECYGALVTALNELLEYDLPHPVSELWNFKENRKAKLDEVINYLFDKLKTLEKRACRIF